ncbi:MAG: hypothetical protein KDB00_04690 [Planctomycetales bacterium]|nr:hypothetical protein [Planctomycetales bacterium]
MTRHAFSLAVLIASSSMLYGQGFGQGADTPMRLSTVVIEDISDSNDAIGGDPLSLERPGPPNTSQADEHWAGGADLEHGDITTQSTRDGATTSQRRSITANQLSRLRKPIAAIKLNGLSTSPPVSQRGFTDASPRWITSSESGNLDSLRTVTTYSRRRLYFEDATLERCGYSDCVTSVGVLTNVHSGAKFLIDSALLPVRMIKERPDELVGSVAE